MTEITTEEHTFLRKVYHSEMPFAAGTNYIPKTQKEEQLAESCSEKFLVHLTRHHNPKPYTIVSLTCETLEDFFEGNFY